MEIRCHDRERTVCRYSVPRPPDQSRWAHVALCKGGGNYLNVYAPTKNTNIEKQKTKRQNRIKSKAQIVSDLEEMCGAVSRLKK